FIPKPRRPIDPACSATRREITGCRGTTRPIITSAQPPKVKRSCSIKPTLTSNKHYFPRTLVPELRSGTHVPKLRFDRVILQWPRRKSPVAKRSFASARSQAELGNEGTRNGCRKTRAG